MRSRSNAKTATNQMHQMAGTRNSNMNADDSRSIFRERMDGTRRRTVLMKKELSAQKYQNRLKHTFEKRLSLYKKNAQRITNEYEKRQSGGNKYVYGRNLAVLDIKYVNTIDKKKKGLTVAVLCIWAILAEILPAIAVVTTTIFGLIDGISKVTSDFLRFTNNNPWLYLPIIALMAVMLFVGLRYIPKEINIPFINNGKPISINLSTWLSKLTVALCLFALITIAKDNAAVFSQPFAFDREHLTPIIISGVIILYYSAFSYTPIRGALTSKQGAAHKEIKGVLASVESNNSCSASSAQLGGYVYGDIAGWRMEIKTWGLVLAEAAILIALWICVLFFGIDAVTVMGVALLCAPNALVRIIEICTRPDTNPYEEALNVIKKSGDYLKENLKNINWPQFLTTLREIIVGLLPVFA